MRRDVTIDNVRIRFTLDGQLPHRGENKLVNYKSVTVFDGVTCRTLEEPTQTRSFHQGRIQNNLAGEVAARDTALLPIFAYIRGIDPVISRLAIAEYTPAPGRANIDETSCLVLVRPVEGAAEPQVRTLWVDPARDYVPLRYMTSDAALQRITYLMDIEPMEDPVAGWLPMRWTSVLLARDGSVISTATSEVTERTINKAVPEEEFTLTFPAGTMVSDHTEVADTRYILRPDGSKYVFSREDLIRSRSYEELLERDGAEAND
jgi:hypothetical protein